MSALGFLMNSFEAREDCTVFNIRKNSVVFCAWRQELAIWPFGMLRTFPNSFYNGPKQNHIHTRSLQKAIKDNQTWYKCIVCFLAKERELSWLEYCRSWRETYLFWGEKKAFIWRALFSVMYRQKCLVFFFFKLKNDLDEKWICGQQIFIQLTNCDHCLAEDQFINSPVADDSLNDWMSLTMWWFKILV